MNIASLLSEMIASPILGGVGGLLASLCTSVLTIFKARQDHKQELALRKMDLEQIHVEGENAVRLKNMDIQQASAQLESNAFTETLRHDATGLATEGSILLTIAEFIRRTFRPMITAALLIAAVSFFFSDFADAAMRMDMVKATMGATVMAITWWFGDRSLAKKVGG